ncbi:tyrosine-type recombinase/integrase [Streptomyces sioyaensis]|uniref:tyrosine-type recombinase/integrase n=1 Tax=Streptomyces sioyaensis TaxID=67364 RepID=UPI003405520D
MPLVQRLRSSDNGPVSYTALGADDLPIWPIDDFLSHLTARRSSPNTVRGYAHDLADFFAWLDQRGRDFRTLTLEQLGEFFEWLRKPPATRVPGVFVLPTSESALETSTLSRKRAALGSFYRFHSRRDASVPALLGDPVGRRPTGRYVPLLAHTHRRGIDPDGYSPIALKPVRKVSRTLDTGEIRRLLDACRRARDRFLITLLNESGLRLGEALGLRHGDLRLRAGEVHVVPRESNVNSARVKGLKARTVPIGPAVLDAYADYMEREYGTLDSDYVFVNLFRSPHGAPMTADSVKDLSRRLRRHSGVAHYSPHALRHTYATRLLRAKVPVEVVSELLGHASVQTTIDTYAHLTVEDHRRVLVEAGVMNGEGR